MASSQLSATAADSQVASLIEQMANGMARPNPDEHRKELEATVNNPEHVAQVAEFVEMLKGVEAQTGGKSIPDALKGNVTAESLMNLMPAELTGKTAAETGIPEAELTAALKNSFSRAADFAKQFQDAAVRARSQHQGGDGRSSIARVQTMPPDAEDEDVHQFQFKNIDELIGAFSDLKLGNGGEQLDFQQLLAQTQQAQSAVVQARGVPVAESATALEQIDSFHKEVNAFVTTYREMPDVTEDKKLEYAKRLMVDFQVARSQSVMLKIGRKETLADVQDGFAGFQAVLIQMALITTHADCSGLAAMIKKLTNPEGESDVTRMSPDELQDKIDASVKMVKAAVEKHSEAEAAHHEAELAKLNEEVD